MSAREKNRQAVTPSFTKCYRLDKMSFAFQYISATLCRQCNLVHLSMFTSAFFTDVILLNYIINILRADDKISFISTSGNCKNDEFRCDNGRCIPTAVKFVDSNPCGDYSDCPQTTTSTGAFHKCNTYACFS